MTDNAFPRFAYVKLGAISAAFLIGVLGISGLLSTANRANATSSGPPPALSGAPGENSCTLCHTDLPVNSGSGVLTIEGVPANYMPGQQVEITVRLADGAAQNFGFQLTAVDATGTAAGTFALPVSDPMQLQVVNGNVGGNPRLYVQHTVAGTVPTSPGLRVWTFYWTAPAQRVGKISFYAAGNGGNNDFSTGGDRIYTTSAATLSGSAISSFDGDGRSDFAIFRPSTSDWWALTTSNTLVRVHFGEPGDVIVPGDYDGDGTTDFALWRPSTGMWYVRLSSGGFYSRHFGEAGDIPVAGDYDGDLKTDVAIWRPSTGTWYSILSSNQQLFSRHWGVEGDIPVQADFDGDGKTDTAVWRPSTGTWWVFRSSDNGLVAVTFGVAGDKPVQNDYDGDGRADFALYRPTEAMWYVRTAADTFITRHFGEINDVPVPADYDGDGKADFAVFRNGTWYVLGTDGPTFGTVVFGETGDIPVPAGYLPN